MNQRTVAAEIAALVAVVIWAYAGAALLVAAAGEGATLSFLSVVAVVVLPYTMSRRLGALAISERSLRWWGVALSAIGLIVILRIEIAGPSQLFDFGWLSGVFLHPNSALEDQGGAIMTVVLLGPTWVWCVVRGRTSIRVDRAMTEAGAGLVVVLIAAAFAGAADAPEALRWLPAPFMVASLLALALLHARPSERDRRALLSPSIIWTAGVIIAIALAASAVSLIEIPTPAGAADALGGVARAIGLVFAWTFSPLFFVIGWLFDHVPWPFDAAEQPQPPDQTPQEEPPKEGEAAQWSLVLGYVVRTGLIVLIIAVAVALIWFAFGRFSRRRDGDGDEVREDVAPEGGSLLDGLRSMLPGLPRRGSGASGRDAIGRLYISMLRAASQRGVERPPATTPLEFAPVLDARFASPIPSTISRAYAEARYAARPPDAADIERLRAQWKDVVGRS